MTDEVAKQTSSYSTVAWKVLQPIDEATLEANLNDCQSKGWEIYSVMLNDSPNKGYVLIVRAVSATLPPQSDKA